jgi:hypothetical protein
MELCTDTPPLGCVTTAGDVMLFDLTELLRMMHNTCSMECSVGVTLLVEKGGDSIQAKPANQTHSFLAKLKQPLQPNK